MITHVHQWKSESKVSDGIVLDYAGHFWKCDCGLILVKDEDDWTAPTEEEVKRVEKP